MALDDNPDEVFDNEPEQEGNGDESSNRSFRYMMIGLFAIGALGVLLIGLIFISKQGSNQQFAAEQAMRAQTNEAVIALSQITPTPLPTDTPAPTNTAVPTKPLPTATPAKKDLLDTAKAAGDLKTLSSLLESAGMAESLKGDKPYTIFAPTDNAFAQVSPESLDALKKDPKQLEELLKYHVVEGALQPSDMATLTEAKTLGGVPISITVNNDTTTVNGVKVSKPEGESSNGVIYPIDSVLVPPDMKAVVIIQSPPPTTAAAGKATPAGGKATTIAQVQGTVQANAATKPASAATAQVPTRVPPGSGTVAPSGGITSTKPISGTTTTGLPTTGAGEDMLLLFLLAVCLLLVIFSARRLRTMPR